jgi:hypothetical protein
MEKSKSIRYSTGNLSVGFNNFVKIEYKHQVNVTQIVQQADLFARQMYINRSLFDFKRFLGSNQNDWKRMLHEVYVYDRCKNIYYGLNSIYRIKPPVQTFSFPGNILLREFLSMNQFTFSSGDFENNFKLFVNIDVDRDYQKVLSEIFDVYPHMKDGMSVDGSNYIYSNEVFECILEGFYNGLVYLQGRDVRPGAIDKRFPFEIMASDNETILAFLETESQNPILNSFMSEKFDSFSYIPLKDPEQLSSSMFNESQFISRALGFTSNSVDCSELGNPFYITVPRNPLKDFLTREELYSITGLKTEEVPSSYDELIKYLQIYTEPDGTVSSGLIDFVLLKKILEEPQYTPR